MEIMRNGSLLQGMMVAGWKGNKTLTLSLHAFPSVFTCIRDNRECHSRVCLYRHNRRFAVTSRWSILRWTQIHEFSRPTDVTCIRHMCWADLSNTFCGREYNVTQSRTRQEDSNKRLSVVTHKAWFNPVVWISIIFHGMTYSVLFTVSLTSRGFSSLKKQQWCA